MKKIARIIVMMCICLIFWGSNDALCQTVTSNAKDNLSLITENFCCFAYDVGVVQANVPVKGSLLLNTPLLIPTKDCKVHRSSMEDIWLETQENEELFSNIESSSVDLLAKNQ